MYISGRLEATVQDETDENDNRVYGMRSSTLLGIGTDVVAVVCHVARLNIVEKQALRIAISGFCEGLAIIKRLRTGQKEKILLDRGDIRAMLLDTFDDPKSINVATQFASSLTTVAGSALRPSSVFPTTAYNNYVKLKDVKVFRIFSHTAGKMIGFEQHITIRSWKGYNKVIAHEVTFVHRTVQNRKNLDQDPTTWSVMALQRRGLFNMTPHEVWHGREGEGKTSIPIDPARLNEPLFLRSRPSGVDLDSPSNRNAPNQAAETDAGFRRKIRLRCDNLGIGACNEGAYRGAYGLRRIGGTKALANGGEKLAQVSSQSCPCLCLVLS